MRAILTVAALATLALCAQATTFDDFVSHHKRVYPTTAEETRARRAFENNAARMKDLSQRNPHAKFSLLSPMSDKDASLRLTAVAERKHAMPTAQDSKPLEGLPTMVDWRAKGAVTPVGDVGDCGDTMAFTITDVAEGANWLMDGGNLVPLATNQVIDCYAHCEGGDIKRIVEKIIAAGGGLFSNASYVRNDCSGTSGSQVATVITAYVPVTPTSQGLTRAVAYQGPIGVGAYAMDWMTYTGGVLTNCGNSTRTDPPDTFATVVGYNDEANPAYWIVKNSWGQDWGENGYIYIARYTDQCVIHTAPFTLAVAPPPSN